MGLGDWLVCWSSRIRANAFAAHCVSQTNPHHHKAEKPRPPLASPPPGAEALAALSAAAEAGAKVECLPLEVADAGSRAALASAVGARFGGKVDLLVGWVRLGGPCCGTTATAPP